MSSEISQGGSVLRRQNQRLISASESLVGSYLSMSMRPSIHEINASTTGSTLTEDGLSIVGSTHMVDYEKAYRDEYSTPWWAAVLIMTNCTIGMGLLNFPKAFSNSGGIMNALGVELVCLVLLIISLLLVGYCCQRYGDVSFQGMVSTHCGPTIGSICRICIFLTNIGACIVLLVVLGDQFDRLMALIYGKNFCHFWYMNRKFLVPVISSVVILPLCVIKMFDFFKYTSFLGVLAALYISFGVALTRYFTGVEKAPSSSSGADREHNLLKVIPLICFAYECHIEAPPMFACLKKSTMSYYARVVAGYVFISFAVYTVGGTFGYLTFGDDVTGDLLLSYPSNDGLVVVAMVLVMCKVVATYPVLFYCCRTVVDDVWRKYVPLRREFVNRLLQTGLLFATTVFVSILVPSITDAIAVIGALSAAFVFVFPGLCFMQIQLDVGGRFSLVLLGAVYVTIGAFLTGTIVTMFAYDYIKGVPHDEPFCK